VPLSGHSARTKKENSHLECIKMPYYLDSLAALKDNQQNGLQVLTIIVQLLQAMDS
jgi:hypothetical protein